MTEPTPTSRGGYRGLLLLLAGVVTTVLLLLIVGKVVSWDQTSSDVTAESPMASKPDQIAPTAAAAQVHQALHALGRICKPNDTTDQTSRARQPVAAILDFARRYPAVSFSIDDETGTTVSLLIVVRQGLRSCSPSLLARVNRALPSQYQTPREAE